MPEQAHFGIQQSGRANVMNTAIPPVSAFLLLMALALWARGLVTSRQGDMIAACGIFATMIVVGILMLGGAGAVPFLGVAMIAWSVDTFAAGAFAGTNCLLKKNSRLAISAGLILLGIVFLLVV